MDDIIVVDKINAWAIEKGDFIRLPNGDEVIVNNVLSTKEGYEVVYLDSFGDEFETFSLDADDIVDLLQYA